MAEQEAQAQNNQTIQVPQELGMPNVDGFKEELSKFLASDAGEYTLDASEVTRIDTAGIQLLLAFVRELEHQARAVHWHEPSPVILNAAHTLAVSQAMGLPAPAKTQP